MKYAYTFLGLAAVASAEWTSIFNITATPDQVIATTGAPAPGQPGAKGQFNYALDSKANTICYDITLTGVTGDYQSAARTATHIHQAVKGASGPPRIAFPNPGPITDGVRRSVGCLTGPFVTGIKGPDNTTDTGAGFTLAQIEANPAGFFTDSHTALFVPGVVRGQLDQDFEIIKGDDYGSVITTATLTKTEEVTITSCKPEVTDCPAKNGPYVTKTAVVYTTVCPVSELPYYTKPAETHPVYTQPAGETQPVYTKPAQTIYTPPYVQPSSIPVQVATGTGAPVATPSGLEFTGAGNSKKVGGMLMAAGLAAALL